MKCILFSTMKYNCPSTTVSKIANNFTVENRRNTNTLFIPKVQNKYSVKFTTTKHIAF